MHNTKWAALFTEKSLKEDFFFFKSEWTHAYRLRGRIYTRERIESTRQNVIIGRAMSQRQRERIGRLWGNSELRKGSLPSRDAGRKRECRIDSAQVWVVREAGSCWCVGSWQQAFVSCFPQGSERRGHLPETNGAKRDIMTVEALLCATRGRCGLVAKWSCSVVSDSFETPWTNLPDSSVHGIFQARVLEWIAISFSRESSQPRNRTRISHIAGRRFTIWATREALAAKWFTYQSTSSLPYASPVLESGHRYSAGFFVQSLCIYPEVPSLFLHSFVDIT